MADVHTTEQRSQNMAAIRSTNTRPELIVRSIAHRLGYRFRLHVRELPGCPDLVFPRVRSVINVHGCYWHMHTCRWGCVTPETNAGFWKQKREATKSRDRRTLAKLRGMGWRVLTIWECQLADRDRLALRLTKFLERKKGHHGSVSTLFCGGFL